MQEQIKAILALLHEVEDALLMSRTGDAMQHLQGVIRRVILLREESRNVR